MKEITQRLRVMLERIERVQWELSRTSRHLLELSDEVHELANTLALPLTPQEHDDLLAAVEHAAELEA